MTHLDEQSITAAAQDFNAKLAMAHLLHLNKAGLCATPYSWPVLELIGDLGGSLAKALDEYGCKDYQAYIAEALINDLDLDSLGDTLADYGLVQVLVTLIQDVNPMDYDGWNESERENAVWESVDRAIDQRKIGC
jgi:hypothetical protein